MEVNKVYKLTWENILTIIFTIIMIGLFILMCLPLILPYKKRIEVSEQISLFINKIINKATEIPEIIVEQLIKFLPADVVRKITKGIPNEQIDPSKCEKLPTNKFKNVEKIKMADNLPWDDRVSFCENRKGTLDDIDLDQHVNNENTKIILW